MKVHSQHTQEIYDEKLSNSKTCCRYTSDGVTTGYDDGGESTEPEHPDKTLFFNTSSGGNGPSGGPGGEDFPVNAISAEELKARARRLNGAAGVRNAAVASASDTRKSLLSDHAGHPSQESDLATEDDEVPIAL